MKATVLVIFAPFLSLSWTSVVFKRSLLNSDVHHIGHVHSHQDHGEDQVQGSYQPTDISRPIPDGYLPAVDDSVTDFSGVIGGVTTESISGNVIDETGNSFQIGGNSLFSTPPTHQSSATTDSLRSHNLELSTSFQSLEGDYGAPGFDDTSTPEHGSIQEMGTTDNSVRPSLAYSVPKGDSTIENGVPTQSHSHRQGGQQQQSTFHRQQQQTNLTQGDNHDHQSTNDRNDILRNRQNNKDIMNDRRQTNQNSPGQKSQNQQGTVNSDESNNPAHFAHPMAQHLLPPAPPLSVAKSVVDSVNDYANNGFSGVNSDTPVYQSPQPANTANVDQTNSTADQKHFDEPETDAKGNTTGDFPVVNDKENDHPADEVDPARNFQNYQPSSQEGFSINSHNDQPAGQVDSLRTFPNGETAHRNNPDNNNSVGPPTNPGGHPSTLQMDRHADQDISRDDTMHNNLRNSAAGEGVAAVPFTASDPAGVESVAGLCPGSSLAACVGVCPGFSTHVYGACVGSCGRRCSV